MTNVFLQMNLMTSSLPHPHLLRLQLLSPPTRMSLTFSIPPLLPLPFRRLRILLLRQIHPVPHWVTEPCHRPLTPPLPFLSPAQPSPLLLLLVRLTLLPPLLPPSLLSLPAALPIPLSMISSPLLCPPLANLAQRSPKTKGLRQSRISRRRRWSTACGAQLPLPLLSRLSLPSLPSPRLAETLMTCCYKRIVHENWTC